MIGVFLRPFIQFGVAGRYQCLPFPSGIEGFIYIYHILVPKEKERKITLATPLGTLRRVDRCASSKEAREERSWLWYDCISLSLLYGPLFV